MNAENIKPHEFKPGESGNPNGRPKGTVSIVTKLKHLMERQLTQVDPITQEKCTKEIQEWIALRLSVNAMNGDISAIKEVLERVDGKVLQKLESTGKDGDPLIPSEQKITVDVVRERITEMLNKPIKD